MRGQPAANIQLSFFSPFYLLHTDLSILGGSFRLQTRPYFLVREADLVD